MPSFWPSLETPTDPPVAPAASRIKPRTVELYTSPWVSGTRAAAYFGPVMCKVKHRNDWDRTLDRAIFGVQRIAARLGANSVVGVEMTIDPFAEPPLVTIIGTAATLESMFG